MAVIYSYEAKLRLANLGEQAISDFIELVPKSRRLKILSDLPAIPGFRKGSHAELREQHKRLLNTVTHTNDPKFKYDGKEWNVLANLWACWAKDCFKDAVKLEKKAPGEYDAEATYQFFQGLVENCGEASCPKESAEKLYLYSGFPNSEKVLALISKLPTQQDVEQRKRFANLPTEVAELRNQIERIESKFHSSEKEISLLSASIAVQIQSIPKVHNELEPLAKDLGLLRTDLNKTSSQLDSQVKAILGGVELMKKEIALHEAHIAELSKERKKLNEKHADTAKLISSIELANRDLIASIERQLIELKISESKNVSSTDVRPSHQPSFNILQVKKDNSAAKRAESSSSALMQISTNLNAVGVQASDADDLAHVVLAGALTGQLLQISGSLADVVATAICTAIGGGNYIEWKVPLGLCDSEQASKILAMRETYEEKPNCLAIKGINKSAFEIYGDGIRDVIISTQLGLVNEGEIWPIVATVADGPTTLPCTGQLVGLGPVIDTEKLKWSRAKPEKFKLGTLHTASIISELKHHIDADELDDFLKEIQNIALPSNQMRKQILAKATNILLGATNGEAKKAFEIVVAFWALPWIKAHGGTRSITSTQVRKYSPGSQDVPMIAKGLAELQEEEAL